METAAQNQNNVDYYQGLLDRCGQAIGLRAYVADDGSRSEDVLRAKVPDILEEDYDGPEYNDTVRRLLEEAHGYFKFHEVDALVNWCDEVEMLLAWEPKTPESKEAYPEGWKHATIHLHPATGEMHSDGDHSVREWIERALGDNKMAVVKELHAEARKLELRGIQQMSDSSVHEAYNTLRTSSSLRIAANYLDGVAAAG